MPLPAPVTIATRPSQRLPIIILLNYCPYASSFMMRDLQLFKPTVDILNLKVKRRDRCQDVPL